MGAAVKQAFLVAARFALSALVWMLLAGLAGLILLTLGVYHLAGPGWAMIAAGASFLSIARFIQAGMTNG